jgi:hypothetical protein
MQQRPQHISTTTSNISPSTGYLFTCDASTIEECLRKGLFGMPKIWLPEMATCIQPQPTRLALHDAPDPHEAAAAAAAAAARNAEALENHRTKQTWTRLKARRKVCTNQLEALIDRQSVLLRQYQEEDVDIRRADIQDERITCDRETIVITEELLAIAVRSLLSV